MLYCTYDQYQTSGGTLDEAAFAPLCKRASKLIDRHTFGRAEAHAAECERCAADLADACVQIIGVLAQSSAMTAATGCAEALGNDPHGLLYRGCY